MAGAVRKASSKYKKNCFRVNGKNGPDEESEVACGLNNSGVVCEWSRTQNWNCRRSDTPNYWDTWLQGIESKEAKPKNKAASSNSSGDRKATALAKLPNVVHGIGGQARTV